MTTKMEGKKTKGRARVMLSDWIMKDGYSGLKERAKNATDGDIGRTYEYQTKNNDAKCACSQYVLSHNNRAISYSVGLGVIMRIQLFNVSIQLAYLQ